MTSFNDCFHFLFNQLPYLGIVWKKTVWVTVLQGYSYSVWVIFESTWGQYQQCCMQTSSAQRPQYWKSNCWRLLRLWSGCILGTFRTCSKIEINVYYRFSFHINIGTETQITLHLNGTANFVSWLPKPKNLVLLLWILNILHLGFSG